MNLKRILLSLIVVVLAFSVGLVTYKAAELFKSFLISSTSDCAQRSDSRSCSNNGQGLYGPEAPLR